MDSVEESVLYVSLRVIAWTSLSVAQLLHTRMKQSSVRKLFQLTNAIALCTCIFALRDFALLLHAAYTNGVVLFIAMCTDTVAESVFLGVLLLLSAGYCITNARFAPAKKYAVFLPGFYCASMLSANIMTVVHTGFREDDSIDVNTASGSIYVFLGLVGIFSLVLSWFTIFDNIDRVKAALQPEVANDPELGGEGNVHANEGYASAEAPPEYDEVIDPATTVEEAVDRVRKIALMNQFAAAVTLYVLARVLAFFVPLFGLESDPVDVFLVLENLVLFSFMAYLGWVFRLRGDSPYLLLGEEEDDNAAFDTTLDVEPSPQQHTGVEMSTQRGPVLTKDPLTAPVDASKSGNGVEHTASTGKVAPKPATVRVKEPQTSDALKPNLVKDDTDVASHGSFDVDTTFTLDDDDESEPSRP